MATALRNLRVPVKHLQTLYRPERWAVAAGGVGALAVLGMVCWWWRSRSSSRRADLSRKPSSGQDEGPASRPLVEPLLRENITSPEGISAEPLEESSDSEIEEVLSRGALSRLAAAKAFQMEQQAQDEAAQEFFSATTETQAGAGRETH